jgi:Ni/Co efflux regulator RcnB
VTNTALSDPDDHASREALRAASIRCRSSQRLKRRPQQRHWVQVGSDDVLVAIATGLIVN